VSDESVIEQYANGEKIRTVVDVALGSRKLLRRKEQWRSNRRAFRCARKVGESQVSCEAEVDDDR